jgi:hypothetical protein
MQLMLFTREQRWAFGTAGPIDDLPSFLDSRVFVGSLDSKVCRLHAAQDTDP